MYVYAHCKQNGGVNFAPFTRLDRAIDYAINNIEVIIGRNKAAKVAKRGSYGPPRDADMFLEPPPPVDQVVIGQPIQFNFNGAQPQEDVPAPPPRKKKVAISSMPDIQEELDKIYAQIDATKADKTIQNITKSIQMVDDYLKFTTGSNTLLHSLEEVNVPRPKKSEAAIY